MATILGKVLTVALGASILFGVASATASARVQRAIPMVQIMHNHQLVGVLAPGAPFTVQVRGMVQQPGGLCVGLASLRDPYAIPVSLGTLQPEGSGLLTLQATVPQRLFPAEPAGPFLLYVGRCTTVAPDGDYADTVFPIVAAAG